jgi:hypothetical protein
MISLVIRTDDSGNTLSNPMLLDNLKMLYPKASINALPTGYAKFIPTPTPNLGVYEKLDRYTYVKVDDYYTQQYHVVQMTDEEKSKAWNHKRYAKGFTIKCLWKSYINAVHPTRIVKITNIEDVFTEPEDLLEYEKSKEALLTLNFIKK